jgi:hypothetical protein
MALSPGTRLGPYEIGERIGAGAMSACGPASERSESSRWRGGGAPRNFSTRTDFAHREKRRWH